MRMKFKVWYSQAVRGDDNNDFEGVPKIVIIGKDHYEKVIFELERLGFGEGNNFSKHGEISNVEIWYSDFWNSFIVPSKPNEKDILFTLDELVDLDRREDF